MSTAGPGPMTSAGRHGSPDGGGRALLRTLARIAVWAGAVGSLVLMLRAGQNTPRFLLVLFVFWVLSPFVAITWANNASRNWSVLTRMALDCVTLVITVCSLLIYAGVVMMPSGTAHAFRFVAVPPASWILLATVVPMAALISRGRSRRGAAS